MTDKRPSRLPFINILQRLADPEKPILDDVRMLDEHTRKFHSMAHVVISVDNQLQMPPHVLRMLLLDAFEAGGEAAIARDRLAALVSTSVRDASRRGPTRYACSCGSYIVSDTCMGDPQPPRCSKCRHAMSHGECPQCSPTRWQTTTGAPLRPTVEA